MGFIIWDKKNTMKYSVMFIVLYGIKDIGVFIYDIYAI